MNITPTEDLQPLPARGRPIGTGAQSSDAVRAVRAKLRLTQQQLAHEINCSLSAVRNMERERRLPGSLALLDAFKELARRANVPLDAVIERN